MKTIAVMNQKGGTGKTTSAINLAGELVRRGKKVLIVDMDTQGNATSNLSLTEIPAATLTDVIVSKTATLADTVCHTTTENLDLIRGGSLLAPALATMQEMPFGRDTTLRRLLPQIPDTYDFVFFDCSPSLESLFNINVLVAVQYVLIPIKVDKNSIEGYDVMLETIQSVREIANPDIRALGIPDVHPQEYRREEGPAGPPAPVLFLPPLHRHRRLRRPVRRNAGKNGGLIHGR